MKRVPVIIAACLTLLPFVGFGADDILPGCECGRDEILANVREAEDVFCGFVTTASMDSKDSDVINMTIQIRDPIRGQESGLVSLTTTRQRDCGVPATIGGHILLVVEDRKEPNTKCNGSGLPWSDEWRDLVYALVTIEYMDKDRQTVNSWLKRRYPESAREEMQAYFSFLEDLDGASMVEYRENEVQYRSLMFSFRDGRLDGYRWDNSNER